MMRTFNKHSRECLLETKKKSLYYLPSSIKVNLLLIMIVHYINAPNVYMGQSYTHTYIDYTL